MEPIKLELKVSKVSTQADPAFGSLEVVQFGPPESIDSSSTIWAHLNLTNAEAGEAFGKLKVGQRVRVEISAVE